MNQDKPKTNDGNDGNDGKEHTNAQEGKLIHRFTHQATNLFTSIWQWRVWFAFLIPMSGYLIFIASTVLDVILFNAIPSTEGEFRFRDIRETSKCVKWEIYNNTQGDAWKTCILSHMSSTARNETLGEYEITTATVFIQSIGHSKRSPPMGPVDDRFISLSLQKKNRSNIYLTLEKVSEAPEVVKKIVGGRHDGGIHAQISDSRDASLRSMNDGYKRQQLDIGTIKWKAKTGSVVTLERFLRYYIQTSAHLAPEYNYYSRNCHHFVVAVTKLLKQLQDIDLGKANKENNDKGSITWSFSQAIITNILHILGTEVPK